MTSDLHIPRLTDIIARAAELRESAVRQHDTACVRQIDRVIVSVACGAKMEWDMGVLLVSSLNTPGAVYRVRCGQCTCEARKPCWHACLYELLIELFETEVVTADQEADRCGACDHRADLHDDDCPGVAYCARHWMEKKGIAIEVAA